MRGLYAISVRGEGIRPDVMRQVDPVVNMPVNSAAMGALLTAVWLLYYYGANLTDGWFGPFCFDSSEIPIITIYAFYIPIFLMVMKKETGWNKFKRFVMPVLSVCGCVFIVIAAFFAHRMSAVFYLIVFAAIMLIAFAAEKKNRQKVAANE